MPVDGTTDIELLVTPASELLLTLSAFSQPDVYSTYEPAGAWLTRTRASASPDLVAAIDSFTAGCDKLFPHVLPLLHLSPAPRDVESFLRYLGEVEAREIRLHLLGYPMRYFRRVTPAEIIRRAADGDREAQREMQRTSYPEDAPWQAAIHRLLSSSPEQVKAELIDILRRWYEEVFRKEESETSSILERDAEAKRTLLLHRTQEEVIEEATGGIEFVPEQGIRHVVLVPSSVIRPWTHAVDYSEVKIFCYGVAEESVTGESDRPPRRLVALTRALGDERRLEVLRFLAGGRYTLGDVADHFGAPKTTIHHHLALLRSAGLVRMRSSDRTYVVRLEALPQVGEMLERYVQGGMS